MAVSAATLIRTSMQDLGVLGAGEAADGSHMGDGLRRLQVMLAGWSLDPLTVVQTQRDEFPIVPNKGTYTIGPGLDFDVARPVGQQSFVGAGLLLMSSTPPVEIPRTVLTYDAYQRIQVKDLRNPLFTTVFYRPGALQRTPPNAPTPPYGIDYGEIVLWPVPTDANPLVLYIEKALPLFENLTTAYPVPDGYAAAIQHNLTVAMASMFQVEPLSYVVRAAAHTLAAMKRNNYQFIDVPLDPMFTMQGGGAAYNIDTGGRSAVGDFQSFVGGSYKAQSPVSDQEELINFYVEASESPGATSHALLFPTPGFEPFAGATAIGGRGMFNGITTADHPPQVGHCFAVFGNAFDEVLADTTVIHRGAVVADENPATICTNGYGSDSALPDDQEGLGQLFVTSGGKGYIYELATDTLTLIPDLDDPDITVTQGACLNGHFLAFDRDHGVIYVSDQLDGMSWNLSNYLQRQIGTDPWRAMIATPYGQLCLPGTATGEFWYFDPTNFPTLFSPDLSGLFSYGCGATFSVAQFGDSVVWLGKAPDGGYQVLQARGYRPARISTHAMEHEAASYPRVDDAVGQCYTEQGHTFYLLTFPTANVTWCYDEAAPEGRRWHKRGTWISEQGLYSYLRPVFHAFAFDKHLMADRETNRIYHMANRFPRDIDGRVIRRLRRSPTVQNENKLIVYNWFELLLETGLGQDANPHGPPPTVMLRISKDGGRTWGDERQASAGALGAFQTRVYWPRIGQARQRVFEVTVSDIVRNWRVTAAYLKVPGEQRQRAG